MDIRYSNVKHPSDNLPDGYSILNIKYQTSNILITLPTSWRHHINNVRQRMCLGMTALKAISGRNLGIQSKALILLYKMWIRPIALYAAPAYFSAAKTHINRIQVIQNSALRVAQRRNRRTHTEDLHEEGSLIPFKN